MNILVLCTGNSAADPATQPDAFEAAFQILRRRALAFDALPDKRAAAALAAIGELT